MTTEHGTLKHAALLSAETWPAHMTLHKWADIAGDTIRTQHALIVQMAETIRVQEDFFNGPTAWDDEQYNRLLLMVNETHAAATQYLKQGPKT